MSLPNDSRPFPTSSEPALFANIKFSDGTRLVTSFESLPDILLDEEYDRVEHVSMTQAEYNALPEYEG